MAMVRYGIKGIAKAYGITIKRVKRRLKKLGIKPAGGIKGNRLYTEADAKAVGEYKRNRLLAKQSA